MNCESPCASCTGSGTTSCSSCAVDHLIYSTTTCGACPSGQYEATANTCGLCNANCLSCLSSSATYCLTCGLLSSTQSYLLSSDHKCYTDCPGATYELSSGGSYTCAACPTGCALCAENGANTDCS